MREFPTLPDVSFVTYGKQKHFLFVNNSANQGPALYGGLLDRCFSDYSYQSRHTLGIDSIKTISLYELRPLAISSEPVRVCLCSSSQRINCTTRELRLNEKRGTTINLIGAVVDQDENPKASVIRADYSEPTAQLGKGEGRKKTGNRCGKLPYHIFTASTSATLTLQPRGPL